MLLDSFACYTGKRNGAAFVQSWDAIFLRDAHTDQLAFGNSFPLLAPKLFIIVMNKKKQKQKILLFKSLFIQLETE